MLGTPFPFAQSVSTLESLHRAGHSLAFLSPWHFRHTEVIKPPRPALMPSVVAKMLASPLIQVPPNKLLELTVDPQAGSLPQTTPRLNGSSTRC